MGSAPSGINSDEFVGLARKPRHFGVEGVSVSDEQREQEFRSRERIAVDTREQSRPFEVGGPFILRGPRDPRRSTPETSLALAANHRSIRGGVIVAGGRSTRFGDRDKVVADLASTSMIRQVANRLTGVVDELIVNCRTDQIDAIERALSGMEVRFAEDPNTDLGPMASIRTGLAAVESEYVAVVTADMPFVAPVFLSHLFKRSEGHDAAVPQLDDGWFQTTQAVYRVDTMADACTTALSRGDRKILAALTALDYVVVSEDEVREYASLTTFENLNTREKFKAAAERLS